MAKIGLKYPVAAVITTDATATALPKYDKGFVIGKAVQADKNIESNNNPLYGDDAVVENDTSFQNGTLTLTVDDFGNTAAEGIEIQAKLLGHKVVEEESVKILEKSAGDNAANVGVGYYKTKILRNQQMYEVTILLKVKFQLPSESSQTKGESIEWQTSEIEGRIMATEFNGKYERTAIFDTEAEAIAFINKTFGITGE